MSTVIHDYGEIVGCKKNASITARMPNAADRAFIKYGKTQKNALPKSDVLRNAGIEFLIGRAGSAMARNGTSDETIQRELHAAAFGERTEAITVPVSNDLYIFIEEMANDNGITVEEALSIVARQHFCGVLIFDSSTVKEHLDDVT